MGDITMDKKELTMKERMHTGDLYLPDDEEIMAAQTLCLEKLYDVKHSYSIIMKGMTK